MDYPLPTPDLPLLRKTLDWAAEEAAKPAEVSLWHQSDWALQRFCGTAFCLAGKVVTDHYPDAELVTTYGGAAPRPGQVLDLMVDGTRVEWHEEARRLLGLTDDEAYDLFSENNDLARVREVGQRIAARAGEIL